MRNNVQTRVASVQTSPLFKTISEGGKDAQIIGTCNNNTNIMQQSFTTQLKEIQATKHHQYKSQLSSKESGNTIDKEHQPSHETKQLYTKKSIHTQMSQRESSRKHNSNSSISDNTQFSRKLQPRRKITTATISIKKAAIIPRRTQAVTTALLTISENSTIRGKKISCCLIITTLED